MCSRKCSSFTYEYACFYIIDGMCCHLSPPLSLSPSIYLSDTLRLVMHILFNTYLYTRLQPPPPSPKPGGGGAARARTCLGGRQAALAAATTRYRGRARRSHLVSNSAVRYGTSHCGGSAPAKNSLGGEVHSSRRCRCGGDARSPPHSGRTCRIGYSGGMSGGGDVLRAGAGAGTGTAGGAGERPAARPERTV